MKIAAFSDGHGFIPKLSQHVDVLIIAGDFVPLDIQCYSEVCFNWFNTVFLTSMKYMEADKIILIPGNHDFMVERLSYMRIKKAIKEIVGDKMEILVDEELVYNGVKFYGTPWCTNLIDWAFYTPDPISKYCNIPKDCDILITHQPPKIDKVGCSNPYTINERNYGSDTLRNIIDERNIKAVVCGHIHTGIHNGIKYKNTMVYNVSLLNESYNQSYDVTYFEM